VGILAHDGGVDVSVTVDLCATQQTNLDPAILQEILKHVSHAADHQ